jgi:hypothetical protein
MSIETRRRADQQRLEEAGERMDEIIAKDEKIATAIKDREDGWVQNRHDKDASRQQNYQRIAKFKGQEMREREKSYAHICDKTKASEDRLDELVRLMNEKQASKCYLTDEVIARARQHRDGQQEEKDINYRKRLDDHKKAAEKRQKLNAEFQAARAKANKVSHQKHEREYERVLKEKEIITPSPRLTKTLSGNYLTYPAWYTEGSVKHFETHKTMSEIRQTNLVLLRRATRHAQEQALNKIKDVKVRVEALNQSKSEAQLRRTDMIKNCAVEKYHLAFQVEKIRDAPPERMNGLLEQMGLDHIKAGGKDDGEDDNLGKT